MLLTNLPTTYSYLRNTTSPNHSLDSMVRTCEAKTATIHIAAFICMIVMIPLTLIGNGLVIAVLVKCPKLRKQTTYTFLMSLAVADLLVGLFTIPLRAKKSWNNNAFCVPESLCWFFNLTEIMFSVVSVVHLLAIGVDRYLSLKYVYMYEKNVTRKKVYLIIFCLWIYSLVISLLSIFQWDTGEIAHVHTNDKKCYWKNKPYYYFVITITFYIPLPFLISIYIYVYRTALRHVHEISKTMVEESQSVKDMKRRKKQLKLLRSIMVLLIVFIICWIPNTLFQMSLLLYESFWKPKIGEMWYKMIYFILVFILAPLNSTINPWIYVIVNDQFRFFFKQFLLKARKEPCTMIDKSPMSYRSTTGHRIRDTPFYSLSQFRVKASVCSVLLSEQNLGITSLTGSHFSSTESNLNSIISPKNTPVSDEEYKTEKDLSSKNKENRKKYVSENGSDPKINRNYENDEELK